MMKYKTAEDMNQNTHTHSHTKTISSPEDAISLDGFPGCVIV